ncbi:hypothetical protein [Proteiniborus sp. MB09-C3]|uniref:hypothetical protein n=1 Tax=Proteiniborus sp. MB09-C3 TaxID=3050072 RepID=UPI002553BF2E|nr:hypothetical protein [Proteiniborus sp. MB09-C3]WIV13191.1 hypothetical protein QO263_05640 [Proteiniborus sp. MB09-C3]
MAEEVKKVTKQSNKPTKAADKEINIIELSDKLDSIYELFTGLTERLDSVLSEVELTNHVNRILIELVGGVDPGRKNLSDIELVKLRNEGVKVKDLARMQGISQCAMSRKLKELREEGVLHDQGREND